MLRFLLFLVLTAVGIRSLSQNDEFRQVKGLPSNEVYNLHIDKKGFLWVAHNFGLARFDGVSFTHFSHPRQNSLSLFDIVEDQQGRIWCHDLVGQMFFVQQEKMHFFADYDVKQELGFPSVAINGNNLFISSKKGLFICDTKTLKSSFIKASGNTNENIASMSVFSNKVLMFGEGDFYVYDLQKPEIGLNKVNIGEKFYSGYLVMLQPDVLNDTALLVDKHEGYIYKIAFSGVKPVITGQKIKLGGINTTSIIENSWFINQTNQSWDLYSNKKISGFNITDIVKDHEGNTWLSSIDKGLLVNYKFNWKNLDMPQLGDDNITCIIKNEAFSVYGTQKGKLIVEKNGSLSNFYTVDVPGFNSSIDYMKFISEYEVLISGIHYVNLRTKAFEKMKMPVSVKGIAETETSYFVASAFGLFNIEKSSYPNFFSKYEIIKKGRIRAVDYDENTKTLIVAGKDGLFLFKNNKWNELQFKGEAIHASDVKVIGNKKYIGTFNRGLLIFGNKDTIIFNSENGLYENSIIKFRHFKNHLWLIGPSSLQLFDLNSGALSSKLKIPAIPGYQVMDINEYGDTVLIASSEGAFFTNKTKADLLSPAGYLIKLNVNGKDTIASSPSLPYGSTIRFSISLPLFSDPGQLFYKYRLVGNGETNWNLINNIGNNINFSSLNPGKYKLEVVAIHPRYSSDGFIISYPFEIKTPWFLSWWFRGLTVILIVGVFYGVYWNRIRQLKKVEKFRRNLSSDLHDDIGSTLSSINIYSSLARQENDNHDYLNAIQGHAQEVVAKLDDLVWTINPKNDNIDNLVERMRSFAVPILRAKGINCQILFENDNSFQQTLTEIRTNAYLALKEMVNNVVKHSEATDCRIAVTIKNKRLSIEVMDNGKGFNTALSNTHRNGLQNLAFRAKENKGWFKLESEVGKGTTCIFTIK